MKNNTASITHSFTTTLWISAKLNRVKLDNNICYTNKFTRKHFTVEKHNILKTALPTTTYATNETMYHNTQFVKLYGFENKMFVSLQQQRNYSSTDRNMSHISETQGKQHIRPVSQQTTPVRSKATAALVQRYAQQQAKTNSVRQPTQIQYNTWHG